jgi:hypothetical protein
VPRSDWAHGEALEVRFRQDYHDFWDLLFLSFRMKLRKGNPPSAEEEQLQKTKAQVRQDLQDIQEA